jgi:two-component system, OmpR family, sensor histidine kinase CpxA
MYSLFWKIFLWFWLTVIVIGVTVVIATLTTGSNDAVHREKVAKLSIYLPLEARHAAEVYESAGKTGLKNHFDSLKESGIIEPYLIDESGKDVLGQKPSARAAEFAKDAREDAPRVGDFPNRVLIATQRVQGASGNRYTMLLVLSGTPFLSLLKGLGFETFLRLLVVLLVGGVFCFWLTRNITKPVVQLSEAAGRIADGQLDARGDKSIRWRRDEIGRLGLSFDHMAGRIESLVQAQQRLLGDVSHELRSPLARLCVALGLLRDCSPEERTEYLDRIELETAHLDKLIGQLLTLARIDSDAESSHKEAIELGSLLQEVAADGNFEAQARSCAVRVDSLDSCTTTGVADHLRRAIENVVRNAIRYTRPSTDVEITVRRLEATAVSRAVIQVRDHGPGVPMVHLGKIFLPFYRVPNANGAQTGGAGLGLAITERIVRMHGGSVRATNAQDGGLLVELVLPLTP